MARLGDNIARDGCARCGCCHCRGVLRVVDPARAIHAGILWPATPSPLASSCHHRAGLLRRGAAARRRQAGATPDPARRLFPCRSAVGPAAPDRGSVAARSDRRERVRAWRDWILAGTGTGCGTLVSCCRALRYPGDPYTARSAPISSLRLVVSSAYTLPASSAASLTPGRPSPAERHARTTAGHRPGHRATRHRNAPCPVGSRLAAATSGPWLRAVPLRRTRCAIKPVIRHKAAVLVVRWHRMSRTWGPTRLYQAPRPGLCPVSVHVGTSEHPDEALTEVLRGAVRGIAGRLIGRAAGTRWNATSSAHVARLRRDRGRWM
jgi:hypothetical protein